MDRVETRTDPLSRDESFVYDLMGNVTSWTDRKGQVTTYQYDALTARPSSVLARPVPRRATPAALRPPTIRAIGPTDIVDSVAGTIERTYDLFDRLTEEVTPEGTVNYTYDDAGRRAIDDGRGADRGLLHLRRCGSPDRRSRAAPRRRPRSPTTTPTAGRR